MGSIEEHVQEFAGLPVRDFDPGVGIVDPAGHAQRIRHTYHYGDRPKGDPTFAEKLDRFLADPAAGRVVALVIGPWQDEPGSSDSGPIVARLAGSAAILTSLEAIFLGDIVREEQELTWIKQADVTPLLEAFPALEHLKVRGSGTVNARDSGQKKVPKNKVPRLRLRPVAHARLRSLTFEAGCLPRDVVKGVVGSTLPRLEHLELWLGQEGGSSDCYDSGDAKVGDLEPILDGSAFPALKSLALRNSAISDAVAVALAKAPILERLEALDLSLGTLGDKGALALIQSGRLGALKRIDVHHHYISEEVLDGLKSLGIALDAEDRREPDADDYDFDEDDEDEPESYRYIAINE